VVRVTPAAADLPHALPTSDSVYGWAWSVHVIAHAHVSAQACRWYAPERHLHFAIALTSIPGQCTPAIGKPTPEEER
jgi:hypothetical protein